MIGMPTYMKFEESKRDSDSGADVMKEEEPDDSKHLALPEWPGS